MGSDIWEKWVNLVEVLYDGIDERLVEGRRHKGEARCELPRLSTNLIHLINLMTHLIESLLAQVRFRQHGIRGGRGLVDKVELELRDRTVALRAADHLIQRLEKIHSLIYGKNGVRHMGRMECE